MKFNYSEVPGAGPQGSSCWRPYIQVRFLNDRKFQDVVALLDSGADLCLFPLVVGEILGLDVKSGPKTEIAGISGHKIDVYHHNIRLIVPKLSGIGLEVGFTDAPIVGSGVLGQRGFFEQYQIKFELYKRQFDVAEIR